MIIIYILTTFFAILALLILIVYLRYFVPLRPKEDGFEYVYVEKDGSVRELFEHEVAVLMVEYDPTDGGRPYIKDRYKPTAISSNEIQGFIPRRRVPKHIEIKKVH